MPGKNLAFLLLLLIGAKAFGQGNVHSVNVTSSKFTIDGRTNVSGFTCELYQPSYPDSILVNTTWANKTLSFDHLNLKYPVEKFNCQLELMNQDLQNLLKRKQHPYVHLQINSIHIKDQTQGIEQLYVDAHITLTIAGVTQSLKITEGMVVNHSESDLTFSGTTSLDMRGFDIEPPTRLLGMVKVDKMLKVSFEVSLHVEEAH